MNCQNIVRFGRLDESAIKTIFMPTRKSALHLANALSYVFWYRHAFRSSECQGELVRVEQGEFWIEFRQQAKSALSPQHSQPEYLFQGD